MGEPAITPWWKTMQLREEVKAGQGRIDDVQMSLHDAVFGKAGGANVPYENAAYYGEITHPAGSLVALMTQIVLRLGVQDSNMARAVWRLDQAMGGGKSHGLIGLWHLVGSTTTLAATDLGEAVFAEAEKVAGRAPSPRISGSPSASSSTATILSRALSTTGRLRRLVSGSCGDSSMVPTRSGSHTRITPRPRPSSQKP